MFQHDAALRELKKKAERQRESLKATEQLIDVIENINKGGSGGNAASTGKSQK